MSKTRLTALLRGSSRRGVVAVVAAGCGDERRQRPAAAATERQTTAVADGGEPLTVGSDIPYPPFEQGKPGNYTGFDIELMKAVAENIGRTPEFQDTSFDTIFLDLAQGKFEAVDLGRDDHRRT